jgi:hypothetical protein
VLLITIASGPNRGRAVRLAEDARHIIGRKAPPLDLDDPKVSRKHAELIAYPDGQVILKDCGSRNGTFVDGKKITGPAALHEGAAIQVGQTVCVFSRVAESVAAMPAAPTAPPPELLEAQQQTRQMLEELRDGLRRIQSSPAAPSAAQLELVQGSILRRLDEVSQRLSQVSQLTERQAAAAPAMVQALSPKLDAILEAQNRPLSATEALAAQLAQLHGKLDAMAAAAAPVYDDTALHARLDEVAEALSELANATAQTAEPEPQPAWVADLQQSIVDSQRAAVQAIEQQIETRAAADAGPATLEFISRKVQSLIETVQKPRTVEFPEAVTGKLDAVLQAVQTVKQSAPPAAQVDVSGLSARLDDLLALVAAQTLDVEHSASPGAAPVAVPMPVHSAELEARLDAVLTAITALGEAVLERPAADHAPEALLLHVAERLDAIASQAQPQPAAAEQLVAEVDRHWIKLEERLMQHLRGASETAESQMRRAIADLTQAVRSMAERSDRVVLEQVLAELRGHNTQATQEMLQEINERVRRLPTAAGHGPGQTVEMNALAQAVRQAFGQVGEQLAVLPEKLNNHLVLGDILDLLRSIERHQRHQSQWLASMDGKLDNLGASETAVFAPITDVEVATDPATESSSLSTGF